MPITRPDNYDPSLYELFVRRYKEARIRPRRDRKGWRHVGPPCTFHEIPNGKTDSNSYTHYHTDHVGANYAWAEGSDETRARIWQAHKDYAQGLLWCALTDERLPQALRDEMARWGYAKDEFVDNDNWPWQLYVREARRMISDYVMTEHDTTGAVAAIDPVAIASYPADSHGVSRFVDAEGQLCHEGGMWDNRTKPCGVSYRAIRPRAAECTNLLVPGAVSDSHVAFAPLRMEPVFMELGQAAGTAAALSLDAGVFVQDVDYAELRAQLVADGQVLP